MAQFVLVTSGITHADFEKAMEIKIRTGKGALHPQSSNNHGVQNQGMYSAKPNYQRKRGTAHLREIRVESGRGRSLEPKPWRP